LFRAVRMKRIVVAENDEDILYILKLILSEAGYEEAALPDGQRIVEGVQEWPDLFILDKDMPSIDGLALCKYLRLNKQTRNIPVIMITAYHQLKEKAVAAGVDDFIEKPFAVKSLLSIVGKYIAPCH
jgi:CheY-like chemotaxis protein